VEHILRDYSICSFEQRERQQPPSKRKAHFFRFRIAKATGYYDARILHHGNALSTFIGCHDENPTIDRPSLHFGLRSTKNGGSYA